MIAEFKPGEKVWYLDATEGYVEAKIKEYKINGDTQDFQLEVLSKNITISLSCQPGKPTKVPLHQNPDNLIGSDNLTELSHLNEPEVVRSLKLRYLKDNVYTNSGLVLVALNPFKTIPSLYSDDTKSDYQHCHGVVKPHLFEVAENALRSMKNLNQNQSIIINGESGAGKTVSAKHIMKYYTGSENEADIEDKVLAVNPLLEALGNAKTERNDNSSRFGKYIKIEFNSSGKICGANFCTYLLEKSRVVYHGTRERNFHIFYQIIDGLDEKAKSRFGLTEIADFNYLKPLIPKSPFDDGKQFKETMKSFELLSISAAQQADLFGVLAAVLHLGNVDIGGSKDESFVVNYSPTSSLAKVCELLGIDLSLFVTCITTRQMKTKEGNLTMKNSKEKAIELRDSIAKYVYVLVFDWIVSYINKFLSNSQHVNFIGVLDIYGFEFFKHNSFEQFCINYANEKLQQEYNRLVFKHEQRLYVEEGLPSTLVVFNDNQPCIDLMEGKGGIIDQLDEQSKVAIGTDQNFRDGLFSSTPKLGPSISSYLQQPKMGTTSFLVKHFAADVTYDATNFLDKNRDSLSENIKMALLTSKNPFLRLILSHQAIEPTKVSVASAFRESLKILCDTLAKTNCQYVRCIKPNDQLINFYDEKYTLNQLLACGIIETVKMAIAGFPSRKGHLDFFDRYGLLVEKSGDLLTDVRRIFSELDYKEIQDFAVGKTLLFMRIGILAKLEDARERALIFSVREVIGRIFAKRICLAHRKDIKSIISCQNSMKRFAKSSSFRSLKKFTQFVQSMFRMIVFKSVFKPTIIIQRTLKVKRIKQNALLYLAIMKIQKNKKRKWRLLHVSLHLAAMRVQKCWMIRSVVKNVAFYLAVTKVQSGRKRRLFSCALSIYLKAIVVQKNFLLKKFVGMVQYYVKTVSIQRGFRSKKIRSNLYEYLVDRHSFILQTYIRSSLQHATFNDPTIKKEAKRAIAIQRKRLAEIAHAKEELARKKAAEEAYRRKQQEEAKQRAQEAIILKFKNDESLIDDQIEEIQKTLQMTQFVKLDIEGTSMKDEYFSRRNSLYQTSYIYLLLIMIDFFVIFVTNKYV